MASVIEINAKLTTALGVLNSIQPPPPPAATQAQLDAIDAQAQAVVDAANAAAARVGGTAQ